MNYDNLIFFKESEFAEWFKQSYYLFGIREIIKINALFPDVIAIMVDDSKKFIELEYHASNFRAHGHYAPHCDLIISYLKAGYQDFIRGVPVIALFECDNNGNKISNIRPSNFLNNLQLNFINSLPKRDILPLDEKLLNQLELELELELEPNIIEETIVETVEEVVKEVKKQTKIKEIKKKQVTTVKKTKNQYKKYNSKSLPNLSEVLNKIKTFEAKFTKSELENKLDNLGVKSA